MAREAVMRFPTAMTSAMRKASSRGKMPLRKLTVLKPHVTKPSERPAWMQRTSSTSVSMERGSTPIALKASAATPCHL